ncbi:YfiR family protein [Fulvivirga ulvae]|uniref:YfiR family protein n=1 Tax=Fulvivirga ulvae TaxID=2904245 RepID=UPI001F214DB9|nr:YfiR family protein [Fulvivirga ulvae]UII30870.1 YfiR family protein [Fulvivirga ulvae]
MRKLFFILTFLFVGLAVQAQNYQLHSVYIYSFIRYIQWPGGDTSSDFVIGVLGDSPLIPHLQKMAEVKKAGNRTIVIKKFNSVNEVANSDILFMSKESGNQLQGLLSKLKNKNTMIITEEEGMGKEGSNINFVIRNGKLAFELNRAAMDRADLKVSTELTRLAIII